MSTTTISHYRIVETIGEGGMGVVYKAWDTRLNRHVALKVLPPHLVESADRRWRFRQEAQAASALNHPNIVTIYDIGEAQGTHFIAMELVAGRTLADAIPHDGLPRPTALKYAVQIADALARAHAARVIHRDLKPGNLMITSNGQVKVLDFGLAKLIAADDGPIDPAMSTKPQTATGAVFGTPAFMSPEQASGDAVDARSDIFSFGAVLYQMITGQRAFGGDSKAAMLAAVLSHEPAPLKDDDELAKIIRRCLRKDPARRYQTMADLKIALEDLGEDEVKAAPKRGWIWAGPLLAMLALIGVMLWKQRPRDTTPLAATALTTLPGVELSPSLSPDAEHVAFTWTGPKQDNPDVYVQRIGSGSPLRLTTDPRADLNPVWSPDGRWIAFLRGTPAHLTSSTFELRLIPPLGGPERKLADVHINEFSMNPVYLGWSPDSKALVVTDSLGEGKPDALFVVALDSGDKRRLTNPQPPVVADTSPAISPDGRSLVFRRSATWDSGELHLLPLREDLTAVGEPIQLTPPSLAADYPAWLPGGKEILFAARGHLWRRPVAGDKPPERLPFVGEDGLMPSISRSRLVYVRSFTDQNIWRIETSNPSPVMHIASTRADLHPRFSPDERRIAFTSTRSGGWELWLADADGSNVIQLTSMGARTTGAPRWSPDGQAIVFASDLEGQFEIYRIPASGGKPHRLTVHLSFDHGPSFSADGKSIYFSSTRTGRHEVWKMPASGGDAIQVTTDGGFRSEESPDGAWLYYAGASAIDAPLWRIPSSGGRPEKLLDGISWWNLVVADRGIYYTDRVARLQFFDFATRKSTTIAPNLGTIEPGLTATRDGRTILFNRIDSAVDDLVLVENFR